MIVRPRNKYYYEYLWAFIVVLIVLLVMLVVLILICCKYRKSKLVAKSSDLKVQSANPIALSNLGRRDSDDSSMLDNNVINISAGEQDKTFSRTSSGLDQKNIKPAQHRNIIPPIRGPPRVRMQSLSALSDNSSF